MPGRNKCKFHDCLSMIPGALEWADEQNVDGLRSFFAADPQKPLYCFASGGSFSPVDYVALLYEKYQGMAKAISPLSMSAVSDYALRTAKILLMTSHGDLDANYVARRAAKVNPENTCAVVKKEDGNDVVNIHSLQIRFVLQGFYTRGQHSWESEYLHRSKQMFYL